jgi:hypothetical protein
MDGRLREAEREEAAASGCSAEVNGRWRRRRRISRMFFLVMMFMRKIGVDRKR